MCLSVHVTDLGPLALVTDLRNDLLAVSERLTADQAVEAVRDVLEVAGYPQREPGRAVCRCGLYLRVPVQERELVVS